MTVASYVRHRSSASASACAWPPTWRSASATNQALTVSPLRAHIASLNEWAGSSTVLRKLALDEDTVTFRVDAGAAKGVVNVSLHERSSYPRTLAASRSQTARTR